MASAWNAQQQPSNPGAWEGSMDFQHGQGPVAVPQASVFQPSMSAAAPMHGGPASLSAPSSGGYSYEDFDNEPPLLEELGINLEHIFLKTKAVVLPFRRFSGNHSALLDPDLIVQDADLAGPLALALLLAFELLCMGKIHFGYIYGFGMFGCLSLTVVLNLLSPVQAVSVWTVTSILGYSLLPVNLLAALQILFFFAPVVSKVLGGVVVLWSTLASTRLLEVGCGMAHQRYLIAYPIALVYSAFVLITIF
jgi:protein YIPF5/7